MFKEDSRDICSNRYEAILYYENDSSYQSIDPALSNMRRGKNFIFEQCDAPAKILTPSTGVIDTSPSSPSDMKVYTCPLELKISKVNNVSGFPKVIEPIVKFKKIREKKIFGKWNYFCFVYQ